MRYIGTIIELFFGGIILYWIVKEHSGFGTVVNQGAKSLVGAEQSLWGS